MKAYRYLLVSSESFQALIFITAQQSSAFLWPMYPYPVRRSKYKLFTDVIISVNNPLFDKYLFRFLPLSKHVLTLHHLQTSLL
jgi:hypothetical protein